MLSFNALIQEVPILPFAHRGAGLLAAENSIAAFQAAYVQASRDGTLWIFHDRDLTRLTGRPGQIADLNDAEIAGLKTGQTEPLPRLDEAMEAFPDCWFNIDAKTEASVAPLSALIERMEAQARVCIGSFSDGRIRRVLAELGGDVAHSLGTGSAAQFVLGSWLGLRMRRRANCAQLPVQHKGIPVVTGTTLARAHKMGMKLHVWTVNDHSEMTRLIDLGVDGLMTDDCVLLREVLEARDLWPIL